MQNENSPLPIDYMADASGGMQATSIDPFVILTNALRRWKLVTGMLLLGLIAAHLTLKLVPKTYKSTVQILVYDPQRQIDAAVQKPISPFVDAVGYDAMNTETNVLKSKSVALRVANELGLDRDPEFAPESNQGKGWGSRIGLSSLTALFSHGTPAGPGTKAEELDEAADNLIKGMDISVESYIINVDVASHSPVKAQQLAETIATDYLANQREARQQALERVATWLKSRADNLQSRVLETESSIEKLKAENDIRSPEPNNIREVQVSDLATRVMAARADVNDKRVRLEQARRVIDTNGDIHSIPEMAHSAALTDLSQKQAILSWNATDLQQKLGEHHSQVTAVRSELDSINKQIKTQAEHVLDNMKGDYEIAVQQEKALEANLQSLSANQNSENYIKLQQMRRVADADRKLYDSYLSQFNDISERRTLQDASARIITPATLPRSASSPRSKTFYAAGGVSGLAGGLLLAFLLDNLRPVVKTDKEVEQTFGQPVVGIIPLVRGGDLRNGSYDRLLGRMINTEPFSQLSEAVRAMRIGLEVSGGNPKVIVVTSALPEEGKSTIATWLAASSASSGKRTILLDCDFRKPTISEQYPSEHKPGLSEFLRGTAKFADVIVQDPITKVYVMPAGTLVVDTPDLMLSQKMRELISILRVEFDYIIADTSPLLSVVDAVALATVADKILVVVEWDQTPRDRIIAAFKNLGSDAQRISGIVLNKVDLNQLPGAYRGYPYRPVSGLLPDAGRDV